LQADATDERLQQDSAHLKAAITLHFAYYNMARVHSSLRVTPAMEAGLTDHVWSLAELLKVEQHAI
jgi:hypothetical protein